MGFQIRDDLLDFTSSNDMIGKPVGNDIRENKMTLPLIYALENSEENYKNSIKSLFSQPDITEDNIKKIIDFADANKGIQYANSQAKYYIDAAIQNLEFLPDSLLKEKLILFAKFMIERNK